MELYLFSINSIEESVLNPAQIKIKKQITTNRKSFEKKRKKEYIEFVEALKKSRS
jgi:hypothetical protein